MLHLFAQVYPSDRTLLRDALIAHLHAVAMPATRGDRGLVARVEKEVRVNPAAHLCFDEAGHATLSAAGRTFQAGRFETPRLGDLHHRAIDARLKAGEPTAELRCFVLDGASPATDVGALQATAPPGSLFQVASQFNCLEAPHPLVTPVASYFDDPTQGPRAAISAFPGTLLRRYAAPAPDGTRFVQMTNGQQLNLLEAVCGPGKAARMDNGYLTTDNLPRPAALAEALEVRFEELRAGVHDAVEVVFGYDWDGPVPGAPSQRIAQVLSSTIAAGLYGRLDTADPAMRAVVRELQRAAHFGALLAAAALGKSYAVLTLVGGGVFGNPIPMIWEAMLWAMDAVHPLLHRDLIVVVNGYNLGRHVPAHELRESAEAGGGTLLVFESASVRVAEP